MVRFLSLINFTDQGVRQVKDTVERADGFRTSVEKAGGKVAGLYWAVGEADGAVIFETPDAETAAKLLLALGHEGNVRTRTLRLYDGAEFSAMLGNL